jgi:DNA-binding NarL/FixJ family response regulator
VRRKIPLGPPAVCTASANFASRPAQLSIFPLAAMRSSLSAAILAAMALRSLIVDDNALFLASARDLLEREGMPVIGVASTSAEALRLVRELRPDVTLVDIDLGDESGFDLARRLCGTADCRVVLISTYPETDFADLIAESPAAGFLAKAQLSATAINDVLD